MRDAYRSLAKFVADAVVKFFVGPIAHDVPTERDVGRPFRQLDDIETHRTLVRNIDTVAVALELNERAQRMPIINRDVGGKDRVERDVHAAFGEMSRAVVLEQYFRRFCGK